MLDVAYVSEVPDPRDLLGVVRFGAGGIPLPQLGGTSVCEVWRGGDGDVIFGAWSSDEEDVEHAARSAYDEILATVRASGFPHLLRVWNHVRDVNAGDGEAERYKRFCAGRHEAFAAAGWPKERFPAASAVGMSGGSLAIYYLAARTAGRNVENPRQVAAYDYPPEYGRRSPSFARATVFGSTLFIAGTSSVVGHETRHRGDVAAQLEETLVNLEAIAVAAGARGVAALHHVKVYLRRPSDHSAVAERLSAALPHATMLYLQADICRAQLLLEIEAVGTV